MLIPVGVVLISLTYFGLVALYVAGRAPRWFAGWVNRMKESEKPDVKERRRLVKLQARADHKRHAEICRYARICEKRMQNLLARRDLARVWQEERRTRVQPVRFDYCLVPHDATALYFHIAGELLPRGVLIENLMMDETAAAIGRDIGRAVQPLDTRERAGAFLVVNMGEGVSRLPVVYNWHENNSLMNVMDLLPKTKPAELAVGMGENRNLSYIEYRSQHFLIGGATGYGKTNWIRQALVTLCLRNGPDRLRLVLLDFKQGVSLRIFRGLPHMWSINDSLIPQARRRHLADDVDFGFVDDKDAVTVVLKAISEEMDARYRLFAKEEVEDIDGYNYRRHDKLPDLLIVIDELADLMLDPFKGNEFRKVVEALILRAAQQGRGAGVFIWAGTQTPRADVITPLIKYNLVIKLAFNCTHGSASRIILDTNRAAGLECRGRLIFQEPGNPGVELQAPLLEHEDAKRLLAQLRESQPAQPATIDPERVWRYSLANLGGRLPRDTIFEGLGVPRVPLGSLLAEWEYKPADKGPLIVLDGQGYIVLPARGTLPRRLHAIEDETLLPNDGEISELIKVANNGKIAADSQQTTVMIEGEAVEMR